MPACLCRDEFSAVNKLSTYNRFLVMVFRPHQTQPRVVWLNDIDWGVFEYHCRVVWRARASGQSWHFLWAVLYTLKVAVRTKHDDTEDGWKLNEKKTGKSWRRHHDRVCRENFISFTCCSRRCLWLSYRIIPLVCPTRKALASAVMVSREPQNICRRSE